jgi:hypothetical protein
MLPGYMRLPVCLALLLVPWPSSAWDTAPHQRITKAALDAMPKRFLDRLGTEATPLIEIYCIFPDRYEEMERFGFVRKSAGPRSVAEIRRYCVRPDGRPVHGATGDRGIDTGSLVFLFERIVTSLSGNQPEEAAKYAGVLSHFIADSLSPPHAVAPEELLDLAGGVNVHSAIERSVPEFTLADCPPHEAGAHILTAAKAILEQLYAGADQNRKDLPSIVKAALVRDERALDVYRLRAGKRAAGILAGALYTLSRMAEPQR